MADREENVYLGGYGNNEFCSRLTTYERKKYYTDYVSIIVWKADDVGGIRFTTKQGAISRKYSLDARTHCELCDDGEALTISRKHMETDVDFVFKFYEFAPGCSAVRLKLAIDACIDRDVKKLTGRSLEIMKELIGPVRDPVTPLALPDMKNQMPPTGANNGFHGLALEKFNEAIVLPRNSTYIVPIKVRGIGNYCFNVTGDNNADFFIPHFESNADVTEKYCWRLHAPRQVLRKVESDPILADVSYQTHAQSLIQAPIEQQQFVQGRQQPRLED